MTALEMVAGAARGAEVLTWDRVEPRASWRCRRSTRWTCWATCSRMPGAWRSSGSTSTRRPIPRCASFARELVDGVCDDRERIDALIASARGALAAAAPVARRPEPAAARHVRAHRPARDPGVGHAERGRRDRAPLRQRGIGGVRERRARPRRAAGGGPRTVGNVGVGRMAEAERAARYDPQAVEEKWQRRWAASRAFAAVVDAGRPRRTTCSRCSRTRRATSTWGTCATTRSAT